MTILSDDDETVEEPLEDEAEDLPADRSYNHQWVKRKVKGHYTNGWFTGAIQYYNERLKKFCVSFSDDSEDLIRKDEFDNVEIFLLKN